MKRMWANVGFLWWRRARRHSCSGADVQRQDGGRDSGNQHEQGEEYGRTHPRARRADADTDDGHRAGDAQHAGPACPQQTAVPCRGAHGRTAPLPDEQERKLLDASSDCFRPLIQAALYTGMRLGELLDLRWGDVDFEARIATVVHGKGEKTRHIPMLPELVEVLEQIPRAVSSKGEVSPWVFNNPDTATRWVDIVSS